MKTNLSIYLIIALTFLSHSAIGQNVKRDLNENILLMVEAKIKPGQFDNLVTIATEMSDVVESTETETLNYEWTISLDSSMCYIIERYANIQAAMAHMKMYQEKYAEKLGNIVEITAFNIYGKPGPAVRETFGMGADRIRKPVAGFTR